MLMRELHAAAKELVAATAPGQFDSLKAEKLVKLFHSCYEEWIEHQAKHINKEVEDERGEEKLPDGSDLYIKAVKKY